MPDSQTDVGDWENYPAVSRPENWDTDGDGMPGRWEEQNGLNPNDPTDGPADADGNGYPNLEAHLHWVAAGNILR